MGEPVENVMPYAPPLPFNGPSFKVNYSLRKAGQVSGTIIFAYDASAATFGTAVFEFSCTSTNMETSADAVPSNIRLVSATLTNPQSHPPECANVEQVNNPTKYKTIVMQPRATKCGRGTWNFSVVFEDQGGSLGVPQVTAYESH